jgi:hypothetical protein
MEKLAIEDIEIGGTYEVCDPVIGRLEPSFIEIIENKPDSFLAKDLMNTTESEFSKALDYYPIEQSV